jgi:hypothetical protein
MDHEAYNALMTTMENDRAARLALEAQVMELSRKISRLSKNLPATRTVQTKDEVASQSFGKTSVFDFADDEEDGDDRPMTKDSRRSCKRDHNEDSGIGTESGDRDYPESFATLNDEHHNSGIYREKAAVPFSTPNATMSLSKLTMLGGMAYPASQQTLSQTF